MGCIFDIAKKRQSQISSLSIYSEEMKSSSIDVVYIYECSTFEKEPENHKES